MDRIWGAREKRATELSTSMLGGGPDGAIVVIVGGDALDAHLVSLGAHLAKSAKCQVHLLHVIEVPRTLPLKAVLTAESEHADKLLGAALERANRVGCQANAFIVQAREAGPAIVDEAKDHRCALLLIGHLHQDKTRQDGLGKTVAYVLANAHCRVWLVQDRQERTAISA